MPPDPLEALAFGLYRGAHLLYHENPPASKLNETPAHTLQKQWSVSEFSNYHVNA